MPSKVLLPAARPACAVALAAAFSLFCGQTPAQPVDQHLVTVSATRFPDNPDRLPYGVSVITASELRRAGVVSVNEALMRLLGLPGHLDLAGGGEYSLDLRGFGSAASGNMVVVIDGLRVSEGDSAGARLAGLAIDTIERIEVLRGSGAVLYGEGATAGVIAITTRGGARGHQALSGQVQATAGSDRLRDLRASAGWAHQGLSLDAAASRRLSDGHRDNFASAQRAASLALNYRLEGLHLAARYAEDRLHSGLPGSLTADQALANPRQASSPVDNGALVNRRVVLQASVDLPAGWSVVVDGGWRQKESRSVFSGFSSAYDVHATQWTARARHEAQWGAWRNQLAIGFDDNRWQRQFLGSFPSLANQVNRGLFLRDELSLPGGTRVAAGIRREAVRKLLDDGFSVQRLDRDINAWELSLLQPFAAGWQAYAHVGRSFRLANADEYSFTPPNTNLRPQVSSDAELGLRWRGSNSSVDARVWRSALKDEIGFDPVVANPNAFSGQGANVNFERTRRHGLELEARHALSVTWALRGTLAWRQARFDNGSFHGNTVPLVPTRSASLGVQWQPLPGHSLDVWARAWSSQHPDMANSCQLPGVAVLDLRYAVALGTAELALALNNAGDRRFATQAFACDASGRATALYPEPGRQGSVALTWRF